MTLLILFLSLLAKNVLSMPAGSQQEATCQHISYASFEGSVCGVIIFKGMSDNTVTVETKGDGIHGFDSECGYHGTSDLCFC